MALLECSIQSNELGMSTALTVSLPTDTTAMPADGYPVVYLLHGHSDDHTGWLRRTNVDFYARERGVAVVMPEVQRSFYCDMKYGLRYFAYVADELPRLCRQMFRLSSRRCDTLVAGLSMGGYGALKCAFFRPETFGACASLSGAVDVRAMLERQNGQGLDEFRAIVGPDLQIPPEDDLYALADRVAARPAAERPRVFACCGTEDFLNADNRNFAAYLTKAGIAHRYEEGPGVHEWPFWDRWLPTVLDFLLENRPAD